MRRITVGLLSVAGLLIGGELIRLRADDKKIDPAGIWQLRVNRPGRPGGESTLKLERAGDKFVGVLMNNQGAAPIRDAEFKDGELSFRISIRREGQEINFLYKGKVTADAIQGQMSASAFGQKRSFPFEGKRKKGDSTIAGLWKITLPLEDGQKLQPTLRLKQQGPKLTGEYVGNSGKEVPLTALMFKNGELSFRAADQIEKDNVTIDYAGKVNGETMAGTAKLTVGPQSTNLKFQAQKIQTPTASMAGTWRLKVPFKDSMFQPILKLTQTGSSLTGTYVGERGETPIADGLIFGDEFSFEVARDQEGKRYRLRYQGRVKGDTLKGTVDYDFDGIAGFLEFEGRHEPGR